MRTTPFRQSGSTLIEALTALLVVAFGMLAIAEFQVSLSASSDIAKQRSEAVRLAQLKVEELRAYQQVESHTGTPHIFNYTDDVVSGADTVGPDTAIPAPTVVYPTNTVYTRVWTVSGSGTDLEKRVQVAVSWADRNGATQAVTLRTVIARAEPVSIGTLAVGPGGSKTRSPKDRNVDIPYPAVSLADGKSGFQPGSDTSPNPNPFFIFDNATGEVLGDCTTPLSPGASVTWGGSCTSRRALLLSGYVRFVYGGWNSNQVDEVFGNPNGLTKRMQADVEFIGHLTTARCYTQRQKTIQRTGALVDITNPNNLVEISSASRSDGVVTVSTATAHGFTTQDYISINSATHFSLAGVYRVKAVLSSTSFTFDQVADNESFTGGTLVSTVSLVQQVTIPEDDPIPSNYSSAQIVSRAVAYTCIVVPVDHDNDGPDGTPKRWSGQFVITPQPTPGDSIDWSLGSSAQANDNQWKLCRYTGNYATANGLTNSEHPLYYRGVTGALDNQNYVAIQSNQNCPTDGLPTFTGNPRDYLNSNTTLHQTAAAGGLPRGGQRSGTNGNNSAAVNGGFTAAEPSDLSVELPMI